MLTFPKTKKEKPSYRRWCLVFTGKYNTNPSGFQIAQFDGRFWTNEVGLLIEAEIKSWAYLTPENTKN